MPLFSTKFLGYTLQRMLYECAALLTESSYAFPQTDSTLYIFANPILNCTRQIPITILTNLIHSIAQVQSVQDYVNS